MGSLIASRAFLPADGEVALPACRRSARALVVADEDRGGRAVRALQRAVDVRSSLVSVVAIGRVPRCALWFAPMSAVTTPARLKGEAAERADRTARQMTDELGDARVERRVVSGWRDVIALLERGCFDVVVVGRPPRPRAQLRRLVDVTASAGIALILADG